MNDKRRPQSSLSYTCHPRISADHFQLCREFALSPGSIVTRSGGVHVRKLIKRSRQQDSSHWEVIDGDAGIRFLIPDRMYRGNTRCFADAYSMLAQRRRSCASIESASDRDPDPGGPPIRMAVKHPSCWASTPCPPYWLQGCISSEGTRGLCLW